MVAESGIVRRPAVVVVAPGRSERSIVVTAHRDDSGAGPGANDNASGTAALIELARAYANPSKGRRAGPAHRIVFLSTDGGAFGGPRAGPLPRDAAPPRGRRG